MKNLGINVASDILKYSGLVVWLTTVLVLVLFPIISENSMRGIDYFGWWLAELLFGLVYIHISWRWPEQPTMPWWFYMLVLVLAAVATSWITRAGIGSFLMMVIASLLPWVTQPRLGITWIVVQSTILVFCITRNPDTPLEIALIFGATFTGLGFFAYIASFAARQLSDARDELRRVNSELRATQSLLTENTRIAERVRIARELHDLVGHHLTALTLNLEVASHLIDNKALEHVQQARSVARLLLSDVREVVSEMRTGENVDLEQALSALVEGVPEPHIHLAIPDGFNVTDPQRAQVLLRCAQELITNAVRHAHARNLWLSLESINGQLHLTAKDDGRGMPSIESGNGIQGMRERLKQLGGEIDLQSSTGQGFSAHAYLPAE